MGKSTVIINGVSAKITRRGNMYCATASSQVGYGMSISEAMIDLINHSRKVIDDGQNSKNS